MEETNKKQLVVLMVAVVVALLIGVGVGGTFHSFNKIQVAKEQVAGNLYSKVISSITAYGKVASVNGNSITLNNLGDTLAISIASDARVFSFSNPAEGSKSAVPVQKISLISDIKTGQNVNVALKLMPNGQMQGISIVILPSVVK